jgi:hypothetical protein
MLLPVVQYTEDNLETVARGTNVMIHRDASVNGTDIRNLLLELQIYIGLPSASVSPECYRSDKPDPLRDLYIFYQVIRCLNVKLWFIVLLIKFKNLQSLGVKGGSIETYVVIEFIFE